MRRYDVIWTEEAVQDLEGIARYIARDSPGNARRVMKRLRDRADSLWSLPERGRVVPELLDLGLRDWRELIVRPFRIVYRISENSVLVEVIFDGRRDAESLLADRLLRR
ncbi:MAG TPA: type II toxin-antitoxin system RelE/ParE family toxin [Thermoanaerobaculia bacterium]|jgi:plasmid stabilization system protein ParE